MLGANPIHPFMKFPSWNLMRRTGIAWILPAGLMSLPMKAAPAVATTQFQPPRVVETTVPQYPMVLLQRSIYEGEVSLIFAVDANGHLVDWLVESSTHPLMAREATDALQRWHFEPARSGGEAVSVRTHMTFSFRATGIVTTVSGIDAAPRVREMAAAHEVPMIRSARELDTPVTPIKRVQPRVPAGEHAGGTALVDFYIDEEGRVRLPVATKFDNEAFAEAAVAALMEWRFAVPLHHGVPVGTHAIQSFTFAPKPESGIQAARQMASNENGAVRSR